VLTHDAEATAQRILIAPTHRAHSARNARVQNDSITGRYVGDVAAHLINDAGSVGCDDMGEAELDPGKTV
jgi:hypothetical protein